MRRLFLILLCVSSICFAAESSNPNLYLEKPHASSMASIMAGGKLFKQNCMVCHTMKYLKYNPIAKELGFNLNQEPMKADEYTLVVPPDLSLVARYRSPAWIYTYLLTFYKDPNVKQGWNNLLVNNSAMLYITQPMQGTQVLITSKEEQTKAQTQIAKNHYFNLLKRVKRGSMSEEQFETNMSDIVNFLTYAGDPNRVEHQNLGWWVIGFLIILLILTYALKKLYWSKIK